jgi:uncharacterized protein
MVVGPRGSGKSTSTSHFADTLIDLSTPGARLAAIEDPDGVLDRARGTVVIDEWQEVPEILGAVKRAVDQDRSNRPGRFIITGSVRAAHQAATWPGTGRLIRVRMYGLTQGELERNDTYNPIDAIFSSNPQTFRASELSRDDYLERIVAGRFPSVIGLSARNRSRWFDAYVEQLIERDAPQVTGGNPRPHKMRAVLASFVARTGQELNKEATARDADVTRVTADTYLQMLEDLSIVIRLPAWRTNRIGRLNRSPKIHVTDPGLAAHLLKTDVAALGRDATLVGQLFETFVVTELLPHVETAAQTTELFHYRDRDGKEVDVVLEQRGRFVGVEVKSATSVDRSSAAGLIWLRDKLGTDFHFGAVLYSGNLPVEIEDRVWALPISILWRPPDEPEPAG